MIFKVKITSKMLSRWQDFDIQVALAPSPGPRNRQVMDGVQHGGLSS
jgi:hypothetical protein